MVLTSNSWDIRFAVLARHISQWSKDPSTKTGAVIVDLERRIVGLGYNGFPRGIEDTEERYADRALKYKLVVHAEANAILNARVDLTDMAMYTTLAPCPDCAKLIIQSGISCVVSDRAGVINADPTRAANHESLELVEQMFDEARVSFAWVEVPRA